MSEMQPPLMTGMALGGVLISAMGAGSTLFLEKKQPSGKSVMRDFIIGAIMVAFIMQLLPESSTAVIQMLLSLVPVALFRGAAAAVPVPSQEGGAAAAVGVGASAEAPPTQTNNKITGE